MVHSEEDRNIFEDVIRSLSFRDYGPAGLSRIIADVGRSFVNRPYFRNVLETAGREMLVVNLRQFDCVTFVETVVALAEIFVSGMATFWAFKKVLEMIRYRGGKRAGFTARLHYFSEWIADNEKKGFLRDLSEEIGGEPFIKQLFFMTSHPELYPPLKKKTNLRAMEAIERRISKRQFYHIPKKRIKAAEGRIFDGDITGITTKVPGLDIQHAGFALRLNSGIHLLHASSQEGKVVVSKRSLRRLVMEDSRACGIVVARVTFRNLDSLFMPV